MKLFRFLLIAGAFATCGLAADSPQSYENYRTEWAKKCAALQAEWRASGGANQELKERLIEAAINADKPEVIDEIAAGGDVAEKEIAIPEAWRGVRLQTLQTLPATPDKYGDFPHWVFRRMTATRFEAWTPLRGWLFNHGGKQVGSARPPRRDGTGREWYGAFLPDGRWVTTDLWEFDNTLTLFSANGKWLKEWPSRVLAPGDTPATAGDNLIGWTRCDRKGEGWLVSIGSGGCRAELFVPPQGTAHALQDENLKWQLCYPRDLEAKGTYIMLQRPSDDGSVCLNFNEAGHGKHVGFPRYWWSDEHDKIIPKGDHNYGFWPGSHDVFIGASEDWISLPRAATEDVEIPKLKTWFFDAAGACRGWIRGAYLADSADAQVMWFRDEDGGVLVLGRDLKVQSRVRYSIAGIPAQPLKLFPDLHLGFFRVKRDLVLARWP